MAPQVVVIESFEEQGVVGPVAKQEIEHDEESIEGKSEDSPKFPKERRKSDIS